MGSDTTQAVCAVQLHQHMLKESPCCITCQPAAHTTSTLFLPSLLCSSSCCHAALVSHATHVPPPAAAAPPAAALLPSVPQVHSQCCSHPADSACCTYTAAAAAAAATHSLSGLMIRSVCCGVLHHHQVVLARLFKLWSYHDLVLLGPACMGVACGGVQGAACSGYTNNTHDTRRQALCLLRFHTQP